ncbi:LPXTG cell wall anchor domain-containing protein [Lactococcus fujiensis]|uniref:Gram-positive cocci surface proteins LPxTG domain-containing protein n=1 Tax=Lactococcus fujiensis JCM 16395 TaxID=1291764 RepID=A0A2A5RNM6_9LACT|nr:LPXTG cell wall anchor domain-containing protein [Lactococcus fujiensis]PCS00955.1 hypothetical protein RT41_GL000745 [Lactococcus fujiensis JCM 16395]
MAATTAGTFASDGTASATLVYTLTAAQYAGLTQKGDTIQSQVTGLDRTDSTTLTIAPTFANETETIPPINTPIKFNYPAKTNVTKKGETTKERSEEKFYAPKNITSYSRVSHANHHLLPKTGTADSTDLIAIGTSLISLAGTVLLGRKRKRR